MFDIICSVLRRYVSCDHARVQATDEFEKPSWLNDRRRNSHQRKLNLDDFDLQIVE